MNYNELISLFFNELFKNTPLLNTYFTQTVFKKLKIKKEERKKTSDKIRYLIKKLERHGLITTKRISKRIYEIYPTPLPSARGDEPQPTKGYLDLLNKTHARNPPEIPQNPSDDNEKTPIKHAYDVVSTPRYPKVHRTWFKTATRYWRRHKLKRNDIEAITEAFEAWQDDVQEKVLLFLTSDGFIEVKEAKNRFTSKSEAVKRVKQAEEIFNNAFSMHDKAIFLTVTLPRCFPLKVSLYILSFLLHRIKAYIRKQTKEKTPHFRVNEPHNDFYPHIHCIIFNTDWLMPKTELTEYLEKHLENFLSQMGEHYRKTINKRATEDDVRSLNKLGKRLLKKYRHYKQKHPDYAGPINWITKVRTENGTPVFENPPPDVQRFFDKQGTQQDGGKVTIWDYLKKYLIKNVLQTSTSSETKSDNDNINPIAFYWLFRLPFFTCSNTLRPLKEKKPPQGWLYLCSCYQVNLQDALEYAEWIAERGDI